MSNAKPETVTRNLNQEIRGAAVPRGPGGRQPTGSMGLPNAKDRVH